ncbi:hypothetical protein HZB02_00475 [Candidatus Woesearchaeota archaeon]|nr:hypothetical protein [Candidatus Woesearchaeota archaeon]
MFTDKGLEIGGKRAVLEYIVSRDPSIPIAPLCSGKLGIGDVLRSDHPREFDDFFGVFDTIFLEKEKHIKRISPRAFSIELPDPSRAEAAIRLQKTGDQELDACVAERREFFERYCNAKGLDCEEVLSGLLIYPVEKVQVRSKGIMFQHPSTESQYIIYGQNENQTMAFAVDRAEGTLNIATFDQYHRERGDTMNRVFKRYSPLSRTNIHELVEVYQRIMDMPQFQDGFTYAVEYGVDPLCVFQVRRFRKMEPYTGDVCEWKDQPGIIHTSRVFGVTPSEGIVVPYFVIPFDLDYNYLTPGLGMGVQSINHENPQGFSCRFIDIDDYMKVFLPNLSVGFAGPLFHQINHGTQEDIAKIPIYLFGMKDPMNHVEQEALKGIPLQVFSNGREAYVKKL